MSRRLIEVMKEFLVKEGQIGKAKLALAVGRGDRMVDRYLKGQSIPSRNQAYRLALACGCNERDALALAGDGRGEAKESA